MSYPLSALEQPIKEVVSPSADKDLYAAAFTILKGKETLSITRWIVESTRGKAAFYMLASIKNDYPECEGYLVKTWDLIKIPIQALHAAGYHR